VVKSFVEGDNGCILLFGPTEGGKTHTLKGKTGSDRGILPRAVEDIFSIIRNSEEALDSELDLLPRQDFGVKHEPDRMFIKVQAYQVFVDKILDLLSGTHKKAHG
jgi:hypothetical protein